LNDRLKRNDELVEEEKDELNILVQTWCLKKPSQTRKSLTVEWERKMLV